MGEASYKNPEILKKIENYCSYQERCKKEVIKKLLTLNLDQSEFDNVINYLIKNNYINEERFALAFTQGKFRIKKWGKIKIILELKKRRIDANLINKAINQITDLDYIGTFDKLSLKQYKSLTGSKDSKKRKFINFLSYRGWEYDLIIKKVNDFF
jgi:regulatory protein